MGGGAVEVINPVNPLSLYTFDLELLLFVGIFSFRLDKQSLFPLRLFVSLALIAVYTVLWDFGDGSLLVDIPCYALLFLLLIGLVYFCFDIPFFSARRVSPGGVMRPAEVSLRQTVTSPSTQSATERRFLCLSVYVI